MQWNPNGYAAPSFRNHAKCGAPAESNLRPTDISATDTSLATGASVMSDTCPVGTNQNSCAQAHRAMEKNACVEILCKDGLPDRVRQRDTQQACQCS